MEETPFKRFVDLIAFDQETNQEQQSLLDLQKESDDLHKQVNDQKTHTETARQEAKKLRIIVDTKELEMKTLDSAEREARTKLDTAQNQKEYQAIKKEIALLKEKQHSFETTLVQAWRSLEVAEKEYDVIAKESEQALETLQQTIADKKAVIAQKKENLEKRTPERVQREQGVPEEWLEKYTRMKEQVTDPVVPVSSDSCSACFSMIPPQALLQIKRRALLQCKGCYRLLYNP